MKKIQRIKIQYFSRPPNTIYPEEKFGPLPAPSSSMNSTEHIEHLPGPPALTAYDNSHLTVDTQVWLLYALRPTVDRTEARKGSQHKSQTRGVAYLGCSRPLLTCMSWKERLLVRGWPRDASATPSGFYPQAFQSQPGRSSSTVV